MVATWQGAVPACVFLKEIAGGIPCSVSNPGTLGTVEKTDVAVSHVQKLDRVMMCQRFDPDRVNPPVLLPPPKYNAATNIGFFRSVAAFCLVEY